MKFSRFRLWLYLLMTNDRKGWFELQHIWLIDMLWGFVFAIVFFIQYIFINNFFISILCLLLLFVYYIQLWCRRLNVYPSKYSWWESWCLLILFPYGLSVFLGIFYALFLLL